MLTADSKFCYAFVLPGGSALREGPWVGQSVGTGLHALKQLLRDPPVLEPREAGVATDRRRSPLSGHRLARAERSRLTLRYTSARRRVPSTSTFYLDRDFASRLQQEDVLYTASGMHGALGVSVLRGGRLLAAAGAVTAVPLGTDVHVRIPFDLLRAAQGIYRKRDPEFSFVKVPVEVTVAGRTRLSLGGRFVLGAYDIFVEHPYFDQTDGFDECAALSLCGVFSSVAANSSAQFLAFGGDPDT